MVRLGPNRSTYMISRKQKPDPPRLPFDTVANWMAVDMDNFYGIEFADLALVETIIHPANDEFRRVQNPTDTHRDSIKERFEEIEQDHGPIPVRMYLGIPAGGNMNRDQMKLLKSLRKYES